MTRKLEDPGQDESRSKESRVPAGRRGESETSGDGAGCIYIRGDGDEVREEVEYQVRAQTGTTAGAGKRLHGNGTRFGLPLDEQRHGEVMDVEGEPIEGGNIAIERKRKLGATE